MPPPLVHVNGSLELHGLRAARIEWLTDRLTLPNDAYVRAKRMRFKTDEPKTVVCLQEFPKFVRIPRGCLDLVKEMLAKDNHELRLVDQRARGRPLTFKTTIPRRLRDYQLESVRELLRNVQGTVLLPCGVGKSWLGIGAIKALGVATLIVVPTLDLADQWLEDLRLCGFDAGLVGGGKREVGCEVVVALVESLLTVLEEDPTYGSYFGFTIYDEFHFASSPTSQRVLSQLPGKFRLGLSATEREGSLKPLTAWTFGPRLLQRTTKEMIALGHLASAEIEFVETHWFFSFEGGDSRHPGALAELDRALAEDPVRNALIADRAAEEIRAGETVLLLANRKTMVKTLTDLLLARGVPCRGLTSATARGARKGAVADLRSGDLPCVIATSLADTGLNIPRLSRVLLAFPQRAKGGTTQRLGRLLRDWPDKKPKLIDFVDSNVPTLKSRAQARRRVYKEAGLIT